MMLFFFFRKALKTSFCDKIIVTFFREIEFSRKLQRRFSIKQAMRTLIKNFR